MLNAFVDGYSFQLSGKLLIQRQGRTGDIIQRGKLSVLTHHFFDFSVARFHILYIGGSHFLGRSFAVFSDASGEFVLEVDEMIDMNLRARVLRQRFQVRQEATDSVASVDHAPQDLVAVEVCIAVGPFYHGVNPRPRHPA